VSGDQYVVPFRGCAVLGSVDLLVRAVHADAQHLVEDPAPVWYAIDARFRKFG
jgi:hypothetical protein